MPSYRVAPLLAMLVAAAAGATAALNVTSGAPKSTISQENLPCVHTCGELTMTAS